MKKVDLQIQSYINLYSFMLMSRESDLIETELVNSGEANFLASSKGHEGSVVLNLFLQDTDYLHCHYRDKALMLFRGISNKMFFYSALAKAESHSYGRQMVSHMSDRNCNILSIVGPVGNSALQAVGIAYAIKNHSDNPIVVCSLGDGTTQQGEVFEAIAEAKRSKLPVLFFIHNNNYAISTKTLGKTFFSLADGKLADSFYDVSINYFDGTRPFSKIDFFEEIVSDIRISKEPKIIIFNVERLDNHSNADNQKLYRSTEELITSNEKDPLLNCYNFLLDKGLSEEKLESIKNDAIEKVRKDLSCARLGSEPKACFIAEKELPSSIKEYRGDFSSLKRLTMLESMREVFKNHLRESKEIFLYGQDIEDTKGDVFGTTKGLSTAFPEQVKNSPLSESTIVGLSIGLSLAGKYPVAFIQFADFLPLAYNQIFSELATMYWRTNGAWQCPMIIFAACGGYRPGLGPFHSQTNEATFAHIPGIDVLMPSNASDAAGLLNAAFLSKRPTLFLYPKKLLNNSSLHDTTSVDIGKHIVPIGKARIERHGFDITLVGLGNTVSLCIQVANYLEKHAIQCEIIDLRTVKPLDKETLRNSAIKTKHLVIVHEDNITCGVGAEIIALVSESTDNSIKFRRVAKSDTYTPCNYNNQLEVLPSFERVLITVSELLDLNLSWEEEISDQSLRTVDVIGASPSDESVLINKIIVKLGDQVKAGDIIVEIEASKSAGEIVSPCEGIIEEICVKVDTLAMVGSPLIRIKTNENSVKRLSKNKIPVIKEKEKILDNSFPLKSQQYFQVGLSRPCFATGSLRVSNQEISLNFPDHISEDISRLTGTSYRYWMDKNENMVDIATKVVEKTLMENSLQLNNIDLIICATSSPENFQSPSVACLILNKLYLTYGEHSIAAYDLNAACSGYIYALQNAHDYLQSRPDKRVLIITAESLSKRLDKNDFGTAFLFADAVSATIVSGNHCIKNNDLIIDSIYLTALAEDGSILNVPVNFEDKIKLQGKKLFTLAVKTMASTLLKCCSLSNINHSNLSLIIPHQANQRILSALENKVGLKPGIIFSNIAKYGNTSSSSIPIALNESYDKISGTLALCSFGGGFTAGAAILKKQSLKNNL